MWLFSKSIIWHQWLKNKPESLAKTNECSTFISCLNKYLHKQTVETVRKYYSPQSSSLTLKTKFGLICNDHKKRSLCMQLNCVICLMASGGKGGGRGRQQHIYIVCKIWFNLNHYLLALVYDHVYSIVSILQVGTSSKVIVLIKCIRKKCETALRQCNVTKCKRKNEEKKCLFKIHLNVIYIYCSRWWW